MDRPEFTYDPSGQRLFVKETFHSIQGEGPDAGTPASFIRLAGCNMACPFCDTDHWSDAELQPIREIVDELMINTPPTTTLFVITGGEPLLQNILPLVNLLNTRGYRVQVETNGTVGLPDLRLWFPPLPGSRDNSIVCSPKGPVINPEVATLAKAFKYIIKDGEVDSIGLPPGVAGPWSPGPRWVDPSNIWLQPMDEQDKAKNAANLMAAARACMLHGYHLSIQMHKLIGIQ